MKVDYKKSLKLMLLTLAEVYGTEMTETKLNTFVMVLGHKLKGVDLNTLITNISSNKSIRRFPIPVEILEAAFPTLDEKKAAIELVDEIKTAISKFGYNRPEDAKEHLGPLAWEVVRIWNGWTTLCRSNDFFWSNNYSRIRDSAQTLIEQKNKGILHERNPKLAQSVNAHKFNSKKLTESVNKLDTVIKSSLKGME